MTKRYALIDSSTGSVNVVIWDGVEEYNPDGILIDVSDRPEIDNRWEYLDGEFIAPIEDDFSWLNESEVEEDLDDKVMRIQQDILRLNKELNEIIKLRSKESFDDRG